MTTPHEMPLALPLRFVKIPDSVCGYVADANGRAFIGAMSPDDAAPVIQAVNSHAALVAERDALREALRNTEASLSGLLASELTIDRDANRTPLRLAIRDHVCKTLAAARAILAKIQEGEQ